MVASFDTQPSKVWNLQLVADTPARNLARVTECSVDVVSGTPGTRRVTSQTPGIGEAPSTGGNSAESMLRGRCQQKRGRCT